MIDPNNLLVVLTINSLLILGIHANSGYEGGSPQVFFFLHKVKAPWWVKKPLIECVSCMASVHSVYVYWPWVLWCGQFGLWNLLAYPLYVVALAGLNHLLGRIANLENSIESHVGKAIRDEFNRV